MNIQYRVFETPEVAYPIRFVSSRAVYEAMKDYAKADREMMLVIFTNTRGAMTGHEVHSIGTVNTSTVYLRELFRSAIMANASSIIIVHNHPSGECEPSEGDKRLTRGVVKAGELLCIKVLDHIILGKGCYYSFGDNGLIEDYIKEGGRLAFPSLWRNDENN